MKSQPVTSERDPIAAPRPPRLAVVGVAASLAAVVFIMAVSIVFLVRGSAGVLAKTVAPTSSYLWLRGEREMGL